MALTKITRGLLNTGVSDSSDATAITIDSSEKVGIGDTSPDAMLKVVSNSATVVGSWVRGDQYGLRVSGGSTSSHYALRIANSSDTTLATFNGDGKTGIGTHAPDVMLDVRGEVAIAYNATYGLRFYNQARSNWGSIGNNSTNSGANLIFKSGSSGMNLLHAGDFQFNSGYGSVATAFGVRVWVNINQTADTIRDSGNVSSISDEGTALYKINFSNAMPDTNYVVLGTASNENNLVGIDGNPPSTYTTSAVEVRIFDASNVGQELTNGILNIAVIR